MAGLLLYLHVEQAMPGSTALQTRLLGYRINR